MCISTQKALGGGHPSAPSAPSSAHCWVPGLCPHLAVYSACSNVSVAASSHTLLSWWLLWLP